MRKTEAGRLHIPGTKIRGFGLNPELFAKLTAKLPPGPPPHRLESFLALEQVLAYVRQAPGRLVIVRSSDAPRVMMAAKLRGVSLPLLAVRTAIERLSQP